MVCEAPRQRQLLISRKGSFFDDPFFRDAREDYSTAVRRIVDRFNAGWGSPRLADSQYHSLYRTLRTARLSYSAHSARFKEEANGYKLVMDVREFAGGEITVRTAGGTVSVRGKMEVDAGEAPAGGGGGGADEEEDKLSTISGKSSSAKTLHRRFTLPVDANCEKVESSLSKDAVLTVTIPKRTDIHYIPVNIESESEGNKENEESRVGARVPLSEGTRKPGVKRPSDTPLEPNRKKSQEEPSSNTNRRRRKHRKEEEKGKEENGKQDRHSRRRSKMNDPEVKDSGSDGKKEEEVEGKRRRRDEGKDGETRHEGKEGDRRHSSDRRSRRENKYEDIQEINIPVRITKRERSDKVPRPTSLHGPRVHTIEIEREGSDENPTHERMDTRKMDTSGHTRPKSFPDRKLDEADKKSLRLTIKPDEPSKEMRVTCTLDDYDLSKNTKCNVKDRDTKPINKDLKHGLYSSKKQQPLHSSTNGVEPISVPSIDVVMNEDEPELAALKLDEMEHSKQNEAFNTLMQDNLINNTIKMNQTDLKKDKKTNPKCEEVNGLGELAKDRLEAPRSSLPQRSSSPLSPGSRIVKVEENQSLMEDGMFKDCWSDFSNTLQDVLSRLQELSSELGQSKLLAPTSSAEQSPPVAEKGSCPVPPLASSVLPPNDVPGGEGRSSPVNKGISAHNAHGNVGGVGGIEGGAKDESLSAHSPWRTGHGRPASEAYVLEARRKPEEDAAFKPEITQATLTKRNASLYTDSPLDRSHGLGSPLEKDFECPKEAFKAASRPASLSLRNVASPRQHPESQGHHGEPSSAGSRSNSLSANDATTAGSLLESLRKHSPVEALQKEFLQRIQPRVSPPSDSEEHFLPVEVDCKRAVPTVGGLKEREDRSESLSPSDIQSDAELDWSESELGSDALNKRGTTCVPGSESSRERDPCAKNSPDEGCHKKEFLSLNDLSNADRLRRREPRNETNIAFAPNIDASPESNVTDESSESPEEERVLHGRFIFPVSSNQNNTTKNNNNNNNRKNDNNKVCDSPTPTPLTLPSKDRVPPAKSSSSEASSVTSLSDVISTVANERRPEIPCDDAMGCERPLAPSARVPLRPAKQEPPRFSRTNRPRDLLLQEERGDVESGGRRANGAMGGLLSRGRQGSTPSTPTKASCNPDSLPRSPASASSPSGRGGGRPVQQHLFQEDKPVPTYVRLRTEPSKRNSGFGHIHSDNVRRMREVWGSKQEPCPGSTPPRPQQKVPQSPSSRRSSSDAQAGRSSPSPRLPGYDSSPRTTSVPSSDRTNRASPSPSPFRKSSPSPNRGFSSPSRGVSSPSYTRPTTDRFFAREKSPPKGTPKPKPSSSSKPSSPPAYDSSSRRGSQSSQGRASPVPPSPCRRCSARAGSTTPRDTPSPSPSLERKFRGDSGRRASADRSRPSATPSKASAAAAPPADKDRPLRRSPPAAETPRASKAHHKIFKRLRDASLQPESEALCFKEGPDRYTMVLDVEEYVAGEIEVLQEEGVLTVKGKVELKDGGGHGSSDRGGHVSVKTFDRTFAIPKNSKEEDVDSALSKDGILTIYIPKKRERVIKIELVD